MKIMLDPGHGAGKAFNRGFKQVSLGLNDYVLLLALRESRLKTIRHLHSVDIWRKVMIY